MPNFNHITWQDLFLSEPGKHINSLATIQNGGASSRHYRVIGAARFPGGDNRIYFDVFDLAGQRITPIYIDWNWENSAITPAPGVGDKLPSEPSGGIDQANAHIWLEVQGDPSERITIPPPDGSSWYVVFQLVDISEPVPEPDPIPEPEPNPPPGQAPATPFDLQVASTTDTTITLRWVMPSADPSTWAERFRVSWSKDMATWQQLTAQSMQATIPNLSPDTLYLFRVQAVNQYGDSPPAEIPGKTAPAPPVEPPNPEPSPLPDDPVGLVTIHYGINDQLAVGHNSPILKQVDPTRSHLKLTISKEQLVALLDYCNRQGLDKAELAVNLVHPIR